MNRTFKGLVALLAAGLLMSLSAAAAQATPTFAAGKYPATVKGEAGEIVIGTEAGTVTCPVDYDGTLKEASSTLELGTFFHWSNCNAWGFGMTINNFCTQLFHATEKQSADQYRAHWEFCPAGGAMEISGGPCTIQVKEQAGLTSVRFDDDTGSPNRVTLDYEVTGLAYTVTQDKFLCPFKGTGAKTDGTITGEAFTLKALNPSKTTEELGLVVSGE